MVEMVNANAVGDGRQINGATEGVVESWIESGIERNPKDGWARDRLPCEREKGRGSDGDTPREGRRERWKNCNSE